VNLTIESNLQNFSIQFFDAQGKLCFEKDKLGNNSQLNMFPLRSGTYTYQVYDQEGIPRISGKWMRE